MTTDTDVLERVREYRSAAQLAVRADESSIQARCLALVDLAEAARAEPDPLVRTWSERAVWEESKSFLGVDDEERPIVPEPFERAQRRLRSEGFETCPRCLSHVATPAEFEIWRNQREDRLAALRRRKEALG